MAASIQTLKQNEYDAENCLRLKIPLNPEKDHDVLLRLCSASSKAKYIKGLMAQELGIQDKYTHKITFDDTTDEHNKSTILSLKFNLRGESALIERIQSVPSKVDYIRTLVRDDIRKNRLESWTEISKGIGMESARMSAYQTAKLLSDVIEQLKLTKSCEDQYNAAKQLSDSLSTFLSTTETK